MAHATPRIKRLDSGAITQNLTTTYYGPRTVLAIPQNANGPVGGKPSDFASSRFPLRISAVYLEVTTLAGAPAPTQLTMRLTRDANADFCVVPETVATIATGVTTATSGSVVFKVEADALLETPNLFLTVRTNTGTAVLTRAIVTYETNLY
jgi:hypothetical protein